MFSRRKKLIKRNQSLQNICQLIPTTFPTSLEGSITLPTSPLTPPFLNPSCQFLLAVSQQEVECALHIEQIVLKPCHLNNIAELLVSCQTADGNEPHVKESSYMTL